MDRRRAKVGLGPLEAYYRQQGLAYQVPTPTHNPNPPEHYVTALSAGQEPKSEIELIGSYEALCAQVHYPAAAQQQQVRP